MPARNLVWWPDRCIASIQNRDLLPPPASRYTTVAVTLEAQTLTSKIANRFVGWQNSGTQDVVSFARAFDQIISCHDRPSSPL